MPKKYLTRRQVRERYGNISDITVRRWIDSGRIDEPLRIGNRHYFSETELDEADRRAKADYRRARAEPPKQLPPQLQNNPK